MEGVKSRWISIAVIALLVVVTGFNTAMLFQKSDQLSQAETKIDSLTQSLASLSGLGGDIAGLQQDLSTVQSQLQQVNTDLTCHACAVSDVVSLIEPAIVRVDVSGRNFSASGSGTIVDNRGYILTNYHVIEGATTIRVTLMSGAIYSASVVGSDTGRDVALLLMSATSGQEFTTVTLATMADIKVGMDVVAAGFPLGTDLAGPATFTKGIVSAMRTYEGYLYVQTDAAVNPGNSGGCMVNMDGLMIGIPSAGIVPYGEDIEDINLVIPVSDIISFLALYI
ncbi:serine protease [Dehalococcoides mccartyi]|jgi:S1-C subfamily serine protease|uniref:S1C family serine protease n=1 Tax=Dehalococcoides mccartyi TaxID=61435 RepID=UPI00099B9947|nr:trypsin-like peptidase domain-containing protein [Dehalococcoides mccartyi]AQX74956.1 serine protease [Dehalococcoides mccartyi]AQY73532.1 serine protease [Dehalococcoides mccartyi]